MSFRNTVQGSLLMLGLAVVSGSAFASPEPVHVHHHSAAPADSSIHHHHADPPAVSEVDALWTHEHVVERLMAQRAVLPMRFGTRMPDRDAVRAKLKPGDFIEVFVDAPIEICEKRDPKGLYKKARAGELKGFTGIDDPYEPPLKPELTLDAATTSPQQAAVMLLEYLEKQGLVNK